MKNVGAAETALKCVVVFISTLFCICVWVFLLSRILCDKEI